MQRRFKITVDGHEYDVAVTEVVEGPGNLYPDRGSMESARSAPGVAAPAPAAAAPKPAAGPGDVVSPIAGVVVSIDVTLGARVESDH